MSTEQCILAQAEPGEPQHLGYFVRVFREFGNRAMYPADGRTKLSASTRWQVSASRQSRIQPASSNRGDGAHESDSLSHTAQALQAPRDDDPVAALNGDLVRKHRDEAVISIADIAGERGDSEAGDRGSPVASDVVDLNLRRVVGQHFAHNAKRVDVERLVDVEDQCVIAKVFYF